MKFKLLFLLVFPCFLYASRDADLLFEATLYQDAIPLYQQEIEETSSGHYRLALSYYHSDQFSKAVQVLQEIANPTSQERYLLALSHNQLLEYSEASIQLKKILEIPSLDDPQFSFEILFELGHTYYLWEKNLAAKEIFLRLAEDNQLSIPSQMYLVRIDLSEEQYEDAEVRLLNIASQPEEEQVQRFETFYHLGEIAFHKKNYYRAIEFFKKSLPDHNPEGASWYTLTMYNLGLSYLGSGEDSPNEEQNLEEGVLVFQKLIKSEPTEKTILALGQIYLLRAKRGDLSAKEELDQLLNQNPHLKSRDAQIQALLLRAEASDSYEVKDEYYRQLTQESNRSSSFYGRAWYLRGLNDYERASSGEKDLFQDASDAFAQAFIHLKEQDPQLAALSIKYEAEAHYRKGNITKALEALNLYRENPSEFEDALSDPDEIDYLYAVIAAHSAKESTDTHYADLAKQVIEETLIKSPNGKYADDNLLLLGTIYYREGDRKAAEQVFLRLASEYPDSSLAGDALFWAAKCVNDRNQSQTYLRRVFQDYPKSQYAAEAYFTYYHYNEYIQGDRTAIKHLENFRLLFPFSIYNLNADYLLGMDFKRDRKTPEGKWIRKQNLTEAIDAFRRVEVTFDQLAEKYLIQPEAWNDSTKVRYRAMLERGRACLEVASQAKGAKEKIYLEYAEEIFRKIRDEFSSSDNTISIAIQNEELYPILEQESLFLFAKTLIAAGKENEAEDVLSRMLNRYQDEKITRGYFLSRVWYELGCVAMQREEFSLALKYLSHADDTAKGKVLSSDEKLDLWIQQSLCLQEMGELNEAMLTLSNVINSDEVSALRLKAMYLRSELYELQGRHELARNQLEATARKGGIWAKKAKQKLEEKHVYQ